MGEKKNCKIEWKFADDDGGLKWFMIANLFKEGSDGQFERMKPRDVVYKGDNSCFTIDKNDDAPEGGYTDHKYWLVGSNGTTVVAVDPTIRNRGR